MPTLFVVVPTFGKSRPPYGFATQHAIVQELNAASLGTYTGAGGTEGFVAFGYRVTDEAAAKDALARAMEKHLPGGEYHIRIGGHSGCNTAFEVLREFIPCRLALRREDGKPLGNLGDVKDLICGLFPSVRFGWTASGPERIQTAEDQGLPLPNQIREQVEGIVSVLEGVAEGEGYRVTFILRREEPVERLLAIVLGSAPEWRRGLAALETAAGAVFRVCEEAFGA